MSENDFVIKRKDEDPYGFWWIARQRGQVPVKLSGAYSTYTSAKTALDSYLVENK